MGAALAGLRSVGGAVAGFARSVGSTALGVFGGNLITSAFGAAKDAIGGAISDSLALNAAYETTQIGLNTLLGTAGPGFQLDLRQFAKDTPFAFEQLAGLSRQLLGTGFAAKSIIPLLTDVGNVSSAMGAGSDGVARITHALQQMKGIGKVQRGELNQLSEVGINGLDILSKSTGKSVAEINDALDKGEIGADTFILAFQQFARNPKFATAMADQAKSGQGIWENLMETLADAKAAVLEPLFAAFKELGGNVLAFTRSATFTEWISAARDAVAGLLQPLGTFLVMAGNIAKVQGQGPLDAIMTTAELWLSGAIGEKTAASFHLLWDAIKAGAGAVVAALPAFLDWLGTKAPPLIEKLATVLGPFFEKLGTDAGPAIDVVIATFGRWKDWVFENVPKITELIVAEIAKVQKAITDMIIMLGTLPIPLNPLADAAKALGGTTPSASQGAAGWVGAIASGLPLPLTSAGGVGQALAGGQTVVQVDARGLVVDTPDRVQQVATALAQMIERARQVAPAVDAAVPGAG